MLILSLVNWSSGRIGSFIKIKQPVNGQVRIRISFSGCKSCLCSIAFPKLVSVSTSPGSECFIKINISIYEGNSSCHRLCSLRSSCCDAVFHGRGFLRHRHLEKGQNGSRLHREKVSCTAALGAASAATAGILKMRWPCKAIMSRGKTARPLYTTPISFWIRSIPGKEHDPG